MLLEFRGRITRADVESQRSLLPRGPSDIRIRGFPPSLLKAIAQVALGSVQGYHGLVLASGLYGASLGGALYSLKMLALERLRARHFARSWALVQAAEALPILLGVPLTGTVGPEKNPFANLG